MNKKLYLICDICSREETNPYDIADSCYCGGHFRPLLIQMHHQFKNGTTVMCSQGAAQNYENLIEETKISHPLPKNAIWMICNEKSELFIKTTDNIGSIE